VAQIFAVDGRLLLSHLTRVDGGRDFYTMFEYHPGTGRVTAVSEEVGWITRVGDRFVYDKSGVVPGDANFWDVPWYINTAAWNNEIEISGAQARQLIGAPRTAMIGGEEQPYTAQRVGNAITVTLLESGEVFPLTLDPRATFNANSSDGMIVDIRGVAHDKIFLAAAFVPGGGVHERELFVMNLDGTGLAALRHNNNPILADPTGVIENGYLHGVSVAGNRTALLRVNTATNEVIELATVRERVWSFAATDTHVLYRIPARDVIDGTDRLGSVAVEQ